MLQDLLDPLLWVGFALGFIAAVALFTVFLVLLGLADERDGLPAPPPQPGLGERLCAATTRWFRRLFDRRRGKRVFANVAGYACLTGFWALFFVVAARAAS